MPDAALEIVGIVGRSDLDRSRPQSRVHQHRIKYDGNSPSVDRMDSVLSCVNVNIAIVLALRKKVAKQ